MKKMEKGKMMKMNRESRIEGKKREWGGKVGRGEKGARKR